MILHLIRHPKPEIEPGICYGRLDIPARIAAADLTRLRAGLPPGLPVWSSPLQRCRMLAAELHAEPLIDERLAEMHFGAWEGCAWNDIPRQEIDAWAADIAGYAPPGGESPLQMQARVLGFLAHLAVPEAVVVTHAGVIRMVIAHLHQLRPDKWGTITPEFAQIMRVEIGPRGTLIQGD